MQPGPASYFLAANDGPDGLGRTHCADTYRCWQDGDHCTLRDESFLRPVRPFHLLTHARIAFDIVAVGGEEHDQTKTTMQSSIMDRDIRVLGVC